MAERAAPVPGLQRLEAASGLQTGIRRGRITTEFRDLAFADLADLDILTVPKRIVAPEPARGNSPSASG